MRRFPHMWGGGVLCAGCDVFVKQPLICGIYMEITLSLWYTNDITRCTAACNGTIPGRMPMGLSIAKECDTMNITFTERKMTVSDTLKEYAEKKCSKLEKYFGSEPTVQITFSNERGMQTAEVTFAVKGMTFRAQERSSDMYASIDGVVASIDRQIQKNKTKIQKRIRQDSFAKAMPIMTDYRDEEFEVLREKVLDVKPMSTEDAILQMNLLGHAFFFFVNADRQGQHCVVYKRHDGGYGMLVSNA